MATVSPPLAPAVTGSPSSSAGGRREAPPTLATAFDPRRNSLTFARLVLASMVIWSHTFFLGGYGHDWLYRFGQNDNFGSLAVAVFFSLSGFLVTRSYCESPSLLRYGVHRVIRIFPGYWGCLAVTAFVFSPVLFAHQHGSLQGFWAEGPQNPWRYVLMNSWLEINQGDVAAVCANLMGGGWNVSIWSLTHEFRCYLLVGLLAFAGVLLQRRGVVLALLAALVVLRLLEVLQPGSNAALHPLLASFWPVRLALNFTIGVAMYLYREHVPIERRLAAVALLALAVLARAQAWWLVAPFAVAYLAFYLAVSPRFAFWDSLGDYSYGVYLYGSVVQQTLVFFGLASQGVLAFFALAMVAVAPLAIGSYHLVERPAVNLGRTLLARASRKRPREQGPHRRRGSAARGTGGLDLTDPAPPREKRPARRVRAKAAGKRGTPIERGTILR